MTDEELFHELTCHTLAHPEPAFIHQLAVDAYTAQHANETTKTIAIVFALVGLYLHIDKGFSGRQVQKAHMQLARRRKSFARPRLATNCGAITVADVVAAPPGEQRDARIEEWCRSVWNSWSKEDHEHIAALVRDELGIV